MHYFTFSRPFAPKMSVHIRQHTVQKITQRPKAGSASRRTAGKVRRVVGVGQEQVVGLGHPEVHHLGCVLQSPHRILVHHVLQTHIVHLIVNNTQRNTSQDGKTGATQDSIWEEWWIQWPDVTVGSWKWKPFHLHGKKTWSNVGMNAWGKNGIAIFRRNVVIAIHMVIGFVVFRV